MLLHSFLRNNLCCSKATEDTTIHFLHYFNKEPLKVLQFLSCLTVPFLPYLVKTQRMERKATLKIFSKHIKLEIHAVETGTNLSKESRIYQFCPSNAASVFESLSDLRHPKTPDHYLKAQPPSSSAAIF